MKKLYPYSFKIEPPKEEPKLPTICATARVPADDYVPCRNIVEEEEALLRDLQSKIELRAKIPEDVIDEADRQAVLYGDSFVPVYSEEQIKEINSKIETIIKTLKDNPNMSGDQISYLLRQNGIDCTVTRVGDFKS